MSKTTVTVEQGCWTYTLEIRTQIDKGEQTRISDFCAFADGMIAHENYFTDDKQDDRETLS